MDAATLFSGIGAPEVAMPHWRWPWHAEIDRFPSAVMAARHPHSINLGDVSADDFCERAAAIARPNVIVFGSPCQSFSVAGKRLGLDDPRGNLAIVALGVVDRLRPGWFVFENVPGLLSSDGGRDFGAFLGLVGQLGYGFAYRVLDAQFFGVPQRRRRVFVVGYLGDWRRAAAVLFEPESLRGDSAPSRETGERVAPTIASRPTGGGGLGTDFDCDGGLIAFGGNNQGGSIDVATAVNAHGGPHGRLDFESETFVTHSLDSYSAGRATEDGTGRGCPLVAHSLRAEGFDADEDGTGRGTPLVPVAFDTTQITSAGNYSVPKAGDPCHPLARGQHPPAIAFDCKAGGKTSFSIGETPGALRGEGFGGGHAAVAVALRGREGGATAELSDVPSALRASQGGGDKPHVLTSVVRRLTPRECERLQGFPDDYTLITYRGKPAADGPRYKALGNSMCVPVMRWILSRVEQCEQALSCIHGEAA